MFIEGKHSLQKFKDMRSFLCELAEEGELDKFRKDFKEINSFLKIRKIMGDDCDYLLSLCKLIYTNEIIMEEINYNNE